MFTISTIIFILLAQQVLSQTTTVSNQKKPNRFNQELYANRVHHSTLQNMTENFCKDAVYKLRMADTIQNSYKNNSGYELGIIAANIMDKYRHMIKIYRYYSNHKDFKDEKHAPDIMLNGYAIMHGDYGEIAELTRQFYAILSESQDRDVRQHDEAKDLAKKYGMSVSAIRDMQKKGVNPADFLKLMNRRSMQKETNLPEPVRKQLQEKKYPSRRQFLLGDSSNINTWTPKKKDTDTQEEEYKRKLRYKMWAEKWNGFNGEIEGIKIADTIARLGLTNDSTFLPKELKGAI